MVWLWLTACGYREDHQSSPITGTSITCVQSRLVHYLTRGYKRILHLTWMTLPEVFPTSGGWGPHHRLQSPINLLKTQFLTCDDLFSQLTRCLYNRANRQIWNGHMTWYLLSAAHGFHAWSIYCSGPVWWCYCMWSFVSTDLYFSGPRTVRAGCGGIACKEEL